jgi:predicted ATPase
MLLKNFRREPQETQELAEQALALAKEQAFALWSAMATIILGWTATQRGQIDQGIEQMRQDITAYKATGAHLYVPYFFALLAEACMQAGRMEESHEAIAAALALEENGEERVTLAEIVTVHPSSLK